jgi:DNA-binding CsgD family transcriptional regulator
MVDADAYAQSSEDAKEARADWLLRKEQAGRHGLEYPALPAKYLQGRVRKREVSIEDYVGELRSADEVIDVCTDARLIAAVERAHLSDEEAQVCVCLRDQRTYREIADLHGLSRMTAWRRWQSARVKIRVQLERDPYWPLRDVEWADYVIPRLLSAVSVIYWHLRDKTGAR